MRGALWEGRCRSTERESTCTVVKVWVTFIQSLKHLISCGEIQNCRACITVLVKITNVRKCLFLQINEPTRLHWVKQYVICEWIMLTNCQCYRTTKGRRNLIVTQSINHVSHSAPMMSDGHIYPKGGRSKLDIYAYDSEPSQLTKHQHTY